MGSSVDALYNTNYLPPKLLHRDQELAALANLITADNVSNQPMNILVHGSFGIGRTTLLRFFGHHELGEFHLPLIRFQGKQSTEIVSDTIHTLNPFQTPACPLPEQWSLLKQLIRKSEVPLIFVLDDVDTQTSEVYKKFLNMCKENNICSMATAPRYYPRQLDSAASQYLDVAIELEPFTDHQFLDIVKQRVTEVFPYLLPSHITEFIADLICILDFQRPATIVELLQNLHPLISTNYHICADQIRQSCLNSRTLHYDFWSGHLSNLTDLDATTVLLLQAIGQYFVNHPGHIYVSQTSLFTQFKQVGEGMGFLVSPNQFTRALNMILFQDLLLNSRYNTQSYFTLLPAEGYLEIVELLLGKNQLEL
ncbi:MAG: hypothetical protein ACFE9D_02725 [Promethearchaeota archaeon]